VRKDVEVEAGERIAEQCSKRGVVHCNSRVGIVEREP
jgi:hypothetical protein